MEIAKRDQSFTLAASSGSKLRYPLRSSAKSKPVIADVSDSSASRRVRALPSVSQSLGALNLSAKDKSTKLPRRMSIPTKSTGSITPVSEAKSNKLNGHSKSDTPLSDVSKSSARRKFSVLSSVSYWLTQIKLSESASKHSVSLGFFKLALESGCEPLQRIKEELKSYVCRHYLLTVPGEGMKDLLQSYNILEEEFEQLKISENKSSAHEEGTFASNHDSKEKRNLKPKSLISTALNVKESNKKEMIGKKAPVSKEKATNKKNDASVADLKKKSLKPCMVEAKSRNAKVKTSVDESIGYEDVPVTTEEKLLEDKENIEDTENMLQDIRPIDAAMRMENIQTS